MAWEDICDCDVVDKERLALFRDRLRRWKEHVGGTDVHSIENQISNLLWDDAVFRTFNEARRLHVETRDPSTGYFGSVIELLDKNFMDSQVMAIRRLVDKECYDPDRAVVSFPTIIAEIKEAAQLYTRENYVCYDGAPYTETATDNERVSGTVYGRHHQYDLLTDCPAGSRSRTDGINPGVFDHLAKEQGEFKRLKTYANKYLAHAADPGNRGKAQSELDKISLCEFDRCYRALFRTASLTGLLIDQYVCCEVPTPQFDQLKDWDKPIATTADRNKLRQYWCHRVGEIDRWREEARFEDRQRPGNRKQEDS